MNILVLNDSLRVENIIDVYSSLIWAKRYDTIGDFELCVPATNENLDILQLGRVIVRESDVTGTSNGRISADDAMIILERKITNDIENGDELIVKGRDLRTILQRRVISSQTILNGTVSNCINTLLEYNAIDAGDSRRNFSNLTIETPTITTPTITRQFTGTVLFDAIAEMCQNVRIGFKIKLVNSAFVFSLYAGIDRSVNQSINPRVIFSEATENLIKAEYAENMSNYANFAYVAGEGEGRQRTIQSATIANNAQGINRFETWVDARNASSNNGEISSANYLLQLENEGLELLSQMSITTDFDAEIEESNDYTFSLGDVVTIQTPQGITKNVRITELLYSDATDGTSTIPTFREEN